MEISSSNSIQDTIHNLSTLINQHPIQTSRLLKSGASLVQLMNDHELSNPGQLTQSDYQDYLLAHFIILDLTNAKYLWLRIPKQFKDKQEQSGNSTLQDVWEIGKELTHKNYSQAFILIEQLRKNLFTDSEKNAAGNLLKLLDVLAISLREIHIVQLVRKTYASIEIYNLKAMLGLSEGAQSMGDAEFNQYLSKRGMSVNGQFVIPGTHAPSSDVVQDSDKKRFELNENRVEKLTQVVQFLEQQKYSFDEIK